MPIQTNLNVSPYFDDTTPTKDFYRVLFKPGVAVQARELNSLQALLQQQVERFGDNIFKAGTIVDGCHMSFNTIPYVKIKDNQGDGAPVNVTQFPGLYVRNAANLQAIVVTTTAGFESRNPNLNTLYVRYINSGATGTDTAFSADQTLTVFSPDNPIFAVVANNGSTGFNKADNVVFVSAVAAQNSTGGSTLTGFSVGDSVTNGKYANSVITSLTPTYDPLSNTPITVIGLKPLTSDLALQQANTAKWTFAASDTIVDQSSLATANVFAIVGTGASATLVTGAVGQITDVAMTSTGSGYYVLPYVTVASTTATVGQINTANLVAQNYLTTLIVANNNLSQAVGSGYSMAVDDGVIYQKGYFARVSKQLVVVSPYDAKPDQVVVGFTTAESLINSNIDLSLLDNAANTFNYAAPGADRLKLSPQLTVLSKNDSLNNVDFLPIAEFSAGQPYIQNQQTQYNIIGDFIAKRVYAGSGNFVKDQFLLSSKSANSTLETSQTSIVIDPGLAYINGYEVQTYYNYTTNINKGIDTAIAGPPNPSASITLNYGNYILVNQVGGQFNFTPGNYVKLYSAAQNFASTKFDQSITSGTPTGTQIGTARIRNFQWESGIAGTPSATYRLYLFDINMSAGQSFKDVKSVYLDAVNDGIADVVLSTDLTTGASIAKLNTVAPSRLLFYAGRDALKNANNIQYQYRTSVNNASFAITGISTLTVSSPDTFPSTINGGDRSAIIVVPTSAAKTANISGNATVTSSCTAVTGTSTNFTTSLAVGDYIIIANSTASAVQQVASINSPTSLTLVSNSSTTISSGNIAIYFPKNIPIDFITRAGRTASVSGDGLTLTLNLGTTINTVMSTAVTFNVNTSISTAPYAVSKTPTRNKYVRLRLSDNLAGVNGPWCMGVPDVFRLRGVYLGSNSTFAPTDSGVTDITNQFFVDHGQRDSYYGISYLQKKSNNAITLSTSNFLLVKYDAFQTSGDGVKTISSYISNPQVSDAANLTQLTAGSNIHTLEIPELTDRQGNYYDLRDCFDFRPVAANSVAYVTTAASAPINPVEPSIDTKFSTTNKKFPVPGSVMTSTIEYYLGRADRIYMDITNQFRVANGTPGATQLVTQVGGVTTLQYKAPPAPNNSLTISTVSIPPYPTLAVALSNDIAEIADTKVRSSGQPSTRLSKYQIAPLTTPNDIAAAQPRGYTMADISKLERRIQNLEYYTSLTLAEADVNNRIIPSSSTQLDRFKFGYIVDSFTDTAYADQSTTCTIGNGRLQAKTVQLTVEHKPDTGQRESLPFNTLPVVSQTRATNGPLIQQVTEVVQTIHDEYIPAKNNNVDATGSLYEDTEFHMSATAGQVTLYLNMLNLIGAVEVYYGNSPGFDITGLTPKYTTTNIVDLTSSDTSVLTPFNPYFNYFNGQSLYNYQVNNPATKPSTATFTNQGGTKWVANRGIIGKLTWNHNPNDGRYVKLRITKYNIANAWWGLNGYYYYYWNYYYYRQYPGVYAYPLYQTVAIYPTDTTETFSVNFTAQLTQFNYTGSLLTLDPPSFSMNTFAPVYVPYYGWRYWYNYGGLWYAPYYGYFADSQIFNISFAGLKPLTTHTFTFDGIDLSSKCRPLPTNATGPVTYNIGDPLKTDKYGALSFAFYYDAGINEATSDMTLANRLLNLAVGSKTFTVQSADNSSRGQGTINIKSYVYDGINTSTGTALSNK
jgi:Domain of unknown function (DUF4815)